MFKRSVSECAILIMCGVLYAGGSVSARPSPVPASLPPGVQFVPNIPYAPPGDLFHVGDLYLPPKGTANHAAIIIVHGGAWIGGTKWERGSVALAETLAQHGYLAYSINYRLVHRDGEFPADVQDVNAAVGFVMSKAGSWGIDRDRVALAGDSAGAHLALLAAYAPDNPLFTPPGRTGPPPHVRAVISFFGPTESNEVSRMGPFQRDILLNYLGKTYAEDPGIYRKASPVTYISGAVPTFLAHGTADALVPLTQSQRLYQMLRRRGVDAELDVVQGAPHGFTMLPGSRRDAVFAKALSFLHRELLGPLSHSGGSIAGGGGERRSRHSPKHGRRKPVRR